MIEHLMAEAWALWASQRWQQPDAPDGQPFNDELLADFFCYQDHKFRTGFLEVYRD